MQHDPTEGLYEALLTDQLQADLEAAASRFDSGARELDPALAPLHLARYIHDRTLQALKGVGKKDQLNRQVALVNALLKILGEQDDPVVDDRDLIVSPGRVLEWLTAKAKPGLGAQAGSPPTRPLKGKVRGLMQGVCHHKPTRTDMFLITLEKSEKEYSPTTLYNDYPISPSLFHWESQGATREKSAKGQRYIHHASRGTNILLFARESKKDDRRETRPYTFLGLADYQSHQAECPIQFVWRLRRPMPARFFEETKVAAG